jgi:aspartate racemase
VGGHVFGFYGLVRLLDPDRPVFGLQFPDPAPGRILPERIEDMAAQFLPEVLKVQPEGPYYLAGYSFGGTVAYELAQQLVAMGREVAFLGMIDTWGKDYPRTLPLPSRVRDHVEAFLRLAPGDRWSYLSDRLARVLRRFGSRRNAAFLGNEAGDRAELVAEVEQIFADVNHRARAAYAPLPFPGRLILFRAADHPTWPGVRFDDPALGWGTLVPGRICGYDVPGTHLDLFEKPSVEILAEKFNDALSAPR